MSASILKTHYRRSATVLTSEQIEEIRHLKNKVPAYMIVKEYHINKNRVHDIQYGMIASVFSKMETTFSRSLRRYNPSHQSLLQRIIRKKKKIIIQFQDL